MFSLDGELLHGPLMVVLDLLLDGSLLLMMFILIDRVLFLDSVDLGIGAGIQEAEGAIWQEFLLYHNIFVLCVGYRLANTIHMTTWFSQEI